MSLRKVSNKERLQLLKLYSKLYKKMYGISYGECFYCGWSREAIDHTPALHMVDLITPKKLRERGVPLLLVPSCRDCNARLGKKPLNTLYERLVFMYQNLTNRYEKNYALWAKDDLLEMSPMFQKMIAGRQIKVDILRDRLRHVEKQLLLLDRGELDLGIED